MKKFVFMGLAAAALFWLSNISQTAHKEREQVQTTILLNQVREVAEEPKQDRPAPTPDPNRMHVTQAINRDDPGLIAKVLKLLRPEK